MKKLGWNSALLGLLWLGVFGCGGSADVPVETAAHPANPQAAAATLPPTRPLVADRFSASSPAEPASTATSPHSGSPATPGHAHGGGVASPKSAAPSEATYTCPMHSDVRAAEPGKCPKCGMKLEPVKTKTPFPEPKSHERRH